MDYMGSESQDHRVAYLKIKWPGLCTTTFQLTSPRTNDYNCLAWAAGDSSRWWQRSYGYYWPVACDDATDSDDMSTEVVEHALETLGFSKLKSMDGSFQSGVEKVAIYSKRGVFTHATRQLKDGLWTSKLGDYEDISHSNYYDLEGEFYGKVEAILQRPITMHK